MLMGDARQLGGGHLGGEALDAVVAAMHSHQQAGAWADGGLVIAGMGAVGSADFVQLHASAGHDVGDAKGAADLDQFASGNDALLARAQAVERQQYGGG